MELVEIIIYVLKLFSLSSFILLTLSYFFFKLKDRTRIKPYMLISTDPAAYEKPEEKVTELESETVSPNLQPEEFTEAPKNKKYSRRFKVINEVQKRQNPVEPPQSEPAWMPEPGWQQVYQPQIRVVAQQIQPANIYNFYSSSSEPMHKLKLSAIQK